MFAHRPHSRAVRALLACLCLMLLAGCGSDVGTNGAKPKAKTFELAAKRSDTLGDANLDFAFRFLKSADVRQEGNAAISPLSLSMVLQMLANGADPGADRELLAALGFGAKIGVPEANAFNARLIRDLRDADGAEFEIANAIWTANQYEPTLGLVDVVEHEYFGTSAALPDDSEAAADAINGWISNHTRKRVTHVVDAKDIPGADGQRVMFLANALAFTGTWRDRFEAGSTGPQPFYAPDEKITVQMMHRTSDDADTDYLAVPGAKGFAAVRLPYGKNGTWSAYVLVPNERDGLNDVIASMSGAAWQKWTTQFTPNTVMLSMPRLDLKMQRDLLDDFAALGVPKGTYNSLVTHSTEPITIDFARQQVQLEVDEAGTKAAAASVVGVSEGAAMIIATEPVTADHPFLFLLADSKTGSIAFAAAIRNPLDKGNVP